jgi:geranylgeranyl pyrophosphate synthase
MNMMIPNNKELLSFLNSTPAKPDVSTEALDAFYQMTLLNPIEDFLSRPKKGLRYELIQLGFQMATESFLIHSNSNSQAVPATGSEDSISLKLFYDVVELLHSGSLIVDDIEDQSKMRRGKPTLHEIYGVPLALNAGNWLYFWPLMKIQNAKIPDNLKQKALLECHKTLLLAHTGQALDIGVKVKDVNPEQIGALVFKTMELKSGALAALAMKLGALCVTENSAEELDQDVFINIGKFGSHFGQLLQIYDDIGNLSSTANPQKRFEDLRLMRPSFFWSALASLCTENEYQEIIKKINQECENECLIHLLEQKQLLRFANAQASALKDKWLEQLFLALPNLSLNLKQKIQNTLGRLSNAY